MFVNALTYITIDAAVVLYAFALACRLLGYDKQARLGWTLGCLFYLTHVVSAFDAFYGWSHAVAFRETARQASAMMAGATGDGIYLNYLFTLVWVVDAVWCWLPGYRLRPRLISISIHAFMAFMVFNGAVVFSKGSFRYAGGVMTALLVSLSIWRLRKQFANR